MLDAIVIWKTQLIVYTTLISICDPIHKTNNKTMNHMSDFTKHNRNKS